MDLTSINEHLRAAEPDRLTLRSYDAQARSLELAFTCEGGPREDELLLVHFHGAVLVHLPAILHAPVRFRFAAEEEIQRLVPPVSYDPDELAGKDGGYAVVVLVDRDGAQYGYYVAAERIEMAWRPRGEGL